MRWQACRCREVSDSLFVVQRCFQGGLATTNDFNEDELVTIFIHMGFIPARDLAGKSAHA